ncbi:MAG: hypothetical protein LPK45_12155, partial [Bacteroidota bacterium]|nr:hypothetical protein [Bacteroidota bacterium]MDX5470577.1 hypothetical protein [Bacteroidota bacterium]
KTDEIGGAGGFSEYTSLLSFPFCVQIDSSKTCFDSMRSRPFYPLYRFLRPDAVFGTSVCRQGGFVLVAPKGYFKLIVPK